MYASPSSIDAPEGIVVAVSPDLATVRVDEQFACPRCAVGRGCGAGIFARGSSRLVEVNLPPGVSVRIGQSVSISLEPERLLHAAWLVYGVPLFALFAAALAAGCLMPEGVSDAAAFAIVAGGLLCGGWWARRRLRQLGCAGRFRPTASRPNPHPPVPDDG